VSIESERLILRPWREPDRSAMAAMCADPEVMWDYERTFDRAESDLAIDRYRASFLRNGFGRFPVLDKRDDKFLGYCGIMPVFDGHPMAPGVEIGWRFTHAAWGHGYATESACACLDHGFTKFGLTEVLSYTRNDNTRSENVMKRLGLTFLPDRFWTHEGRRYVVYVARR
jgi:RimJ/RimL family protein N-acetyltransferase